MEQNVYSVSELNSRVKMIVNSDPLLQNIGVQGELSN